MPDKTALIIGASPAGLTAALELLKHTNIQPIVLEGSGDIGAHFSQRSGIFIFPNKAMEADAIILRLDSPTTKLHPQEPGKDASLAAHLQMHPASYLASIECLLASEAYGVLLWNDPWLALSRNTSGQESRGNIMQKFEHLKKEWQVDAKEYQGAMQKCRLNEHTTTN